MQQADSKYKDQFVVGVDFGEATTGLALGKNGTVTPVRAVNSKDRMFVLQQISKFARGNRAKLIVIGLPLSLEEKETGESIEVRRFAKLVQTHLGTPVKFVNEYGSTKEAMAVAIQGELPQKTRRKVDGLSAAVILKRFFTDEGL